MIKSEFSVEWLIIVWQKKEWLMIEYIYLYKNELNNRFEYVFCLNKFKCKNYNLKTKTINFNQFYIDKMSYNGILSNTSKSII
jgi:hypothetical protein